MIITRETDISHQGKELGCFWENADYACAWKGLVFIPGVQAGQPSVEYVVRSLAEEERTLPEALLPLKGIFFLTIRDKRRQVNYVLTDNSGLFKGYFAKRLIGTSYLELVRHLRLRTGDLSPEAVVEFLHLGNIYFNRTFTPGIEKIGHDEILTFGPDGEVQQIPKPLPALENPPTYSLTEYFQELAASIRGENISLDLTGGFDSRLVACLLDHAGLDFEVSLSGAKTYGDFAIARKVADALGKELQVTYHQVNENVGDVEALFQVEDGLGDVLTFHRLSQYHSDRRERGVTLALSGVGGELYKDFWWLQDFPFYNTLRPNIARLYDLRIEPLRFPHSILANDLEELSINFRARMLKALARYLDDSNTKTYDRIYYYFKMQEMAGRIATSTINHYLNLFIPLLDPDLVTVGFNLPRRQRFFNSYHRSLLYRLYPQVAKIRTTEGVTASLSPAALSTDIARYIGNKGKRALKKVSQRLWGQTRFQDDPDHPDLRRSICSLRLTGDMLTSLKDHGILNPVLCKDGLNLRYLGRILTLGLLLGELNQGRNQPDVI
ncbi:MAG: asparagine synthase-related protein [Candidatus Neomarinimicrobiota bacterium]